MRKHHNINCYLSKKNNISYDNIVFNVYKNLLQIKHIFKIFFLHYPDAEDKLIKIHQVPTTIV